MFGALIKVVILVAVFLVFPPAALILLILFILAK
jgi:hypothetical protein